MKKHYREFLGEERGTGNILLSLSELLSVFIILILLETLSNTIRPHLINFLILLSGETMRVSADLWSVLLTRSADLGAVYVYLVLFKKRSVNCMGFRTETAYTDFCFGLRVSLYLGAAVIFVAALTGLVFKKDILRLLFGSGLGPAFRTPEYIFSYTLVAGLFAPLVEEILFRGLLYPVLRERLSFPAAVFFNAALFSLAHSASSGQAIVQFIGGLMFAALFEKKHSIVSPYVVHSLGNISIFAVQYLYL